MATCQDCGKSGFGFFEMQNGKCPSCRKRKLQDARLSPEERSEHNNNLSKVILTTEDYNNLPTKERLQIVMVSCDCSFDANVLKAEGELQRLLRERAVQIGADAIIAISFHFVENYAAKVGFGEVKTFKMIGCGTAVKLEVNP